MRNIYFIGKNCGICRPIKNDFDKELMRLDYERFSVAWSTILDIFQLFNGLSDKEMNKKMT